MKIQKMNRETAGERLNRQIRETKERWANLPWELGSSLYEKLPCGQLVDEVKDESDLYKKRTD